MHRGPLTRGWTGMIWWECEASIYRDYYLQAMGQITPFWWLRSTGMYSRVVLHVLHIIAISRVIPNISIIVTHVPNEVWGN